MKTKPTLEQRLQNEKKMHEEVVGTLKGSLDVVLDLLNKERDENQRLRQLVMFKDVTDQALRYIFRWCNDEFNAGRFDEVGKALTVVEEASLSGDLLVGWLSATVPAASQLKEARAEFAARVRPRLVELFGEERVQSIYSRLG